MKDYYEARAPEYDEWYEGTGVFAPRDRPGWHEDVAALRAVLAALPPARTLDVACGTGYLTRDLRGEVTGIDQSGTMISIARQRVPEGRFVVGEAIPLPFADGQFSRVFTGHFYGHLSVEERARFLAEARRVAGELVVADTALQPDHEPEEWQERVLNDGSRHRVYKRFFSGEGLAEELGGGEVLHAGPWFVVVRSRGSGGGPAEGRQRRRVRGRGAGAGGRAVFLPTGRPAARRSGRTAAQSGTTPHATAPPASSGKNCRPERHNSPRDRSTNVEWEELPPRAAQLPTRPFHQLRVGRNGGHG